jgi:hypothetical protein
VRHFSLNLCKYCADEKDTPRHKVCWMRLFLAQCALYAVNFNHVQKKNPEKDARFAKEITKTISRSSFLCTFTIFEWLIRTICFDYFEK